MKKKFEFFWNSMTKEEKKACIIGTFIFCVGVVWVVISISNYLPYTFSKQNWVTSGIMLDVIAKGGFFPGIFIVIPCGIWFLIKWPKFGVEIWKWFLPHFLNIAIDKVCKTIYNTFIKKYVRNNLIRRRETYQL